MYTLSFTHVFQTNFYLSACKIPENQESASLTVLNEALRYTGYTMTPCILKVFFITTYICLCDNSHIWCLWHEKDPIWLWGTKVNVKLAAWTLHRFSALKLNHPLFYDDDTLTHADNGMMRTILIVGSRILNGRSWSYFDIELCTVSTLKGYNHYT